MYLVAVEYAEEEQTEGRALYTLPYFEGNSCYSSSDSPSGLINDPCSILTSWCYRWQGWALTKSAGPPIPNLLKSLGSLIFIEEFIHIKNSAYRL
jgi:hypothetical protein